MPRNQATLKLPNEHAAQLRQLAVALEMTLTRLIGRMIRREVNEGTLPDATPGFGIKRCLGGLSLKISNASAPFKVSSAEGSGLASSLENVIGKGSATALPLGTGGLITISRKGTGVVIDLDHLDGSAKLRRTVNPEIARDIARQLRAAS